MLSPTEGKIKIPGSPRLKCADSPLGTPLEESRISFQLDATIAGCSRAAKIDHALRRPISKDFNNFTPFETNHEPRDIGSILVMGFSSLGSIYGDIGTSPLYTLAAVFHGSDNLQKTDIVGGISCVIWLFTFIVVLKYVFIVMVYGPNNGEGGQIAIYTKIANALSIGPYSDDDVDPDHISDTDFLLSRTRTSESYYGQQYFVSEYLSKFILFLCFLGCSLVIADGLLTPTTSVLSAVEGIEIIAPGIAHMVVPISCGILVILFFIQRYGADNISIVFAPIIFVWLLLLGGIGIYNITLNFSILEALNPLAGFEYLKIRGALNVFGSVMLCVTGTEAMFADIGHFGRFPIQITLVAFVYPSLMLAYLGQGAYLLNNSTNLANVFYASIPSDEKLYWLVFILAIFATVIASQALILGVFSILRQLIQIDCFPNFKIIHSSKNHFGQVYIPTINFLLMVGVIGTTLGFGSSSKVASVYGLGVSLDFLVTTILITISMIYVYNFHFIIPLLFFLTFGGLDLLLIASNSKKIIHGAWFSLLLAIVFTTFITFWYWGRFNVKENFEHPILLENRLFEELDYDERPIIRKQFSAITFVYTKNVNITPDFMISSLNSIMVFVHINVKSIPYSGPFYDNVVMERISPGFYKATINFGFMDELIVDSAVLERLISEISPADLKVISKLVDADVIHIIESEKVRAKKNYFFYAGDCTTTVGVLMSRWYGFLNGIRKYLIEYLFATIHDLFNSNDILDNELILGEGEVDVVYLGSIVRI